MSWGPVTPARIDFSDPAAPTAPDYGDVYHARAGALAQARQVFLAGNGLPGRWAGRARFVVLETGFGLGHNFLATWAAWRDDPARPERLVYLSVDRHPPSADDLARAHRDSPLPALAGALQAAWPPVTPDLHLRDFDDGRVRLLLALGDARRVLPELLLAADAIYLDGFAPRLNAEMWDARLLQQLGRLAAPGATLATWSVAAPVRQGLASAGFEVRKAPGFGGKREVTVARFAPRHQPPPPPGRLSQPQARQVAVVGAGLAGAAVAAVLARQGLAVTVLEAAPGPAQATSGNAGGLFHSVLHPHDGAHARWLRAAALHAEWVLRPLITGGAVPGAIDGLLRGEHRLDLAAMQALLAAQGQPAAHVAALAHGMPDGQPAWLFNGGGWLAPAALVRHWLQQPGIGLRCAAPVHRLARVDDGQRWQLLADDGRCLAEADAVVLCNAHDAARLLGQVHLPDAPDPPDATGRTGPSGPSAPSTSPATPVWPLQRVRGQTTLLPADLDGLAALPLQRPLADSGYALRLPDGRVLCGATAQPGDDDPQPRPADQHSNLAALQRLTGWQPPADLPPHRLDSRVGWRLTADDRLPLLGPAPVPTSQLPAGRAITQVRQLPRMEGLWLFTALGSRGITHAALAGEVLAARLTGAPVPLPASVLDALDPARFQVRAMRRA